MKRKKTLPGAAMNETVIADEYGGLSVLKQDGRRAIIFCLQSLDFWIFFNLCKTPNMSPVSAIITFSKRVLVLYNTGGESEVLLPWKIWFIPVENLNP